MSPGDPTIRVLSAADAAAFRALRLNALALSPESFGADLEEEQSLPMSEFERRTTATDRAFIAGAFDEGGALVGSVGWYRERGTKASHKSVLWGTFVSPDARTRGIGSKLVSFLIARARAAGGVRLIQLHVAAENAAAMALYAKHGWTRIAVHPESLRIEGRFIDEELWILWLEGR